MGALVGVPGQPHRHLDVDARRCERRVEGAAEAVEVDRQGGRRLVEELATGEPGLGEIATEARRERDASLRSEAPLVGATSHREDRTGGGAPRSLPASAKAGAEHLGDLQHLGLLGLGTRHDTLGKVKRVDVLPVPSVEVAGAHAALDAGDEAHELELFVDCRTREVLGDLIVREDGPPLLDDDGSASLGDLSLLYRVVLNELVEHRTPVHARHGPSDLLECLEGAARAESGGQDLFHVRWLHLWKAL
ncbi:MAG: hypothetical protein R3F14_08865 [Polyangiaceae bacterium]